MRSNRADITPQVVSGIHAKTSLADVILGMEVSENFAVGKEAVNSYAASAMYIADAKSAPNAVSASQAVTAQAQAQNAYQSNVVATAIAGTDLTKQADALVDNMKTADQINAAVQAGQDAKLFEVSDAKTVTDLVAAGKLDDAKAKLKTYHIAFSSSDAVALSNYVDKLKTIK